MGVKKYFKKEFQWSNFGLEYDIAPDFYLGCWQRNRSCVPLLCLRAILCAGNVAIVVASWALLANVLSSHGFWWIYLTHWGIVANALTATFAFAISLKVYFSGPIESTFGLPWYIKLYWFLFNASVPVAFMITLFYWTFISGAFDIPGLNVTLDVFVHGINSVMMVLLLISARHPTRLLHFHHTVGFGIFYLIFNIIYYYAGGLDPNGNVWVYPMLDWSNPGPTVLVVVGVAIGLIILHCVVVLIALCRNHFSRRFRKDRSFSVSG
ncbi:protein rolling stone-like [Leguminivora glycinivorella]|uniref:protein rolling stone-like n=1 Tax=Leguminivora glycinivorella TaxID=1035111 RepID=UPI00200E246E|nr:protein rolling stone-like [Leguminivora glycinivorella]